MFNCINIHMNLNFNVHMNILKNDHLVHFDVPLHIPMNNHWNKYLNGCMNYNLYDHLYRVSQNKVYLMYTIL